MDWVLLSGIKSFHDLTFRFKGAAVASEPGSVSCVLEVSSHRHFFFLLLSCFFQLFVIFALILFSHSGQCVVVVPVDKR